MKQNVGKIDRLVRIIAGAALLSFVFTHEGDLRWLGLIGILPLISGAVGFCWMYKLCKCSTCCCSSKGEGEASSGGCCGGKAKTESGEKPAGHCGCGH